MRTLIGRGHRTESIHHADATVYPRDGAPFSLGVGETDPEQPGAFMRSMAKPFQSLSILEAGVGEAFSVTEEELAVTTASHAGENYHHQLVASYLHRNGLDESHLKCGVHAPFSKTERLRRLAAGEELSVLGNNCSGKHTGMLLLARHLAAPLETYLDREHPVQKANRRMLERFMGQEFAESDVAIDGCGVPTFYATLSTMAKAFHRLGDGDWLADHGLAQHADRIHGALKAHPRAFSGEARLPDRMRRFLGPAGLFSKEGAEGGVAIWGDPGALVMKSVDGDERGIRYLIPELLADIGWIHPDAREQWRDADPPIIKNVAGRTVGAIDVSLT